MAFLRFQGTNGLPIRRFGYYYRFDNSLSSAVVRAELFEAPASSFSLAYGIAAETDVALTLSARAAKLYGLASETDTKLAGALGASKTYSITQELDSTFPLNAKASLGYAQAQELDSTLALAVSASQTYGLAQEDDLSAGLTYAAGVPYGIAQEANAVIALGTGTGAFAYGVAVEMDRPLNPGFVIATHWSLTNAPVAIDLPFTPDASQAVMSFVQDATETEWSLAA